MSREEPWPTRRLTPLTVELRLQLPAGFLAELLHDPRPVSDDVRVGVAWLWFDVLLVAGSEGGVQCARL